MTGNGMEASFCSCDYDPFDFYHATTPVARKPHTCCECGGVIPPGEQYERAATVFEGMFVCFKTCLICSQIRRDFCAPYQGLHEVLWELLGTDYVSGEAFGDEPG